MGQGRGSHSFFGDELGTLAGVVVARIRPNQADRETVEDCWQTAYVAGLEAQRSARRAEQRTCSNVLILAMQTAVYRTLRKRKELRESDLQICA